MNSFLGNLQESNVSRLAESLKPKGPRSCALMKMALSEMMHFMNGLKIAIYSWFTNWKWCFSMVQSPPKFNFAAGEAARQFGKHSSHCEVQKETLSFLSLEFGPETDYWDLAQPQFLRQELIAPSSGLLSRLWGRRGADVLPRMLEPPGTLLNMAKRIELFNLTTPPSYISWFILTPVTSSVYLYYTTHNYWSDKPT